MHTKLTLRLDQELVERAKAYAKRSGKSVSQIVTDYFTALTSDGTEPKAVDAPITRSLRGILRNSDVDEQDYQQYLEEKHL